MTRPPLALHSSAVVKVRPILLQLFLPLQSFCAVLHEPCPLQLLMPKQSTVLPLLLASSALAVIAPEIKSIAAALAMRIPLGFIFSPFCLMWRQAANGYFAA